MAHFGHVRRVLEHCALAPYHWRIMGRFMPTLHLHRGHLRFIPAGAIICAAIAIGVASRARIAAAASPDAPANASVVTVPADPARDAALKTYLQRRFKIPSPDEIKLGPMVQSPFPGMFARPVMVSNDKGQSTTVVLFVDKDQTKALIVDPSKQMLDLSKDPWGRMNVSGMHLEDRPTLGPANAPVTLIEFADFECPFCAHAFGLVETLENSTYKGQVRVIYKYYPINGHPWAYKAALAAECARLQNPGAFWDFARHFYSKQGSISTANLQQHIDDLASSLKLDDKTLNACIAGTSAPERIKQDVADATAARVSSTPSFFINGIPVFGLPDDRILDFVVGSELAPTAHASR
jgi:protein-disulfide isomerase